MDSFGAQGSDCVGVAALDCGTEGFFCRSVLFVCYNTLCSCICTLPMHVGIHKVGRRSCLSR